MKLSQEGLIATYVAPTSHLHRTYALPRLL